MQKKNEIWHNTKLIIKSFKAGNFFSSGITKQEEKVGEIVNHIGRLMS